MSDFPSLHSQGAIAIDCETFDPNINTLGPGAHRDGYIAGIAIATEAGFKNYYPVAHEGGPNLDKAKVFNWLGQQLKTSQPKIGSHLIYDLQFLAAAGIAVQGPLYDIQNAEPLLDETQFSYSLESISQRHLGEGKRDEKMNAWIIEKFGKKKKPAFHIWQTPPSIVKPYALFDVTAPLKIFKKQKKLLEQQDLWNLFVMESDLIPMLLAMRQRGVPVNVERAEELYKVFTRKQRELERAIKKQTGITIQPWAARNLAQIFDHIGEKYPRTAKTAAPSFTKNFLEFHPHPIAKQIKQIRQYDKLRETFINNAILEGHYKGKIYCQFNQLRSDEGGTVSGRFSCSQPNLQQIPIRTDDGKLIRSIFVAETKKQFVKFDYSQIEYRLIAHDAAELDLPGHELVTDAYINDPDADFHQVIAEMTNVDRYSAKTINFGVAYGEGVKKLSASLGMSLGEGKAFLNAYHRKAPFMRPLSQHCMQEANEHGMIKTLLGRVRRFNMWESFDLYGQAHYSRERVGGSKRAFTYSALNARIQGSAADLMKQAMRKIWKSGICDVLGAPHLTIHDELDWSFTDNRIGRQALREAKHIMENVEKLHVPLKVDMAIGPNWGDCK